MCTTNPQAGPPVGPPPAAMATPPGHAITGVADYYCDHCGFVRFDANQPVRHRCNPDRGRLNNFVDRRRQTCGVCIENDNGVCQALDQPDKPRLVEIGVRNFAARCPRMHWPAVRVQCPGCNARLADQAGVTSCRYCGWQGDTTTPVKLRPRPFTGPITKHLLFFFCPRVAEPTAYHLDQLRKSVPIFNGRRVCCVARDRKTLERKIESKLLQLFDEVFYVPNQISQTEALGFIPMLERVESTDENQVICYAHSKGMRSRNLGGLDTISPDAVRRWTQTMYEHTVRNWLGVREALEAGHSMAGAFKWTAGHFNTRHGWHYSGTFYWIRSAALFSKPDWRYMDEVGPWGPERYPGVHFLPVEGANLFGPDVMPPSLYNDEAWETIGC